MNSIVVSNYAQLQALQNHTNGEIAYCDDDQKCYIYKEEIKKWEPLDLKNEGISLNLYELNKNVVNQLQPMTNEEIKEKIETIENLRTETINYHYMLLCKDFNYYTIFEYEETSYQSFGEVVCDIISELGKIISIDPTETRDAIEIWIVPNEEETPYVFYLFPYDAGVVYYG